jgi:hypothetical protein
VSTSRFQTHVEVADSLPGYWRVPMAFVREKGDHVVLESGLEQGDEVVSIGALVLDQISNHAQVPRVTEMVDNSRQWSH